mmetsp:Transcript_44787/g.83633  ORF Transcript_44787/g.83633 Transcript_44787/m.83633 type:complete len:82 (-) Transcript_44787:1526-1771(-)
MSSAVCVELGIESASAAPFDAARDSAAGSAVKLSFSDEDTASCKTMLILRVRFNEQGWETLSPKGVLGGFRLLPLEPGRDS